MKRPPDASIRPWHAVIGLWCLVGMVGGVGAQEAEPAEAPEQVVAQDPLTTQVSDWVAAVSDPAADRGERAAAAAQLIGACPAPAALTAVDRLVLADPADPTTRQLLLEAMLIVHRPDATLWPMVRDLAMRQDDAMRPFAIQACSVFRTRPAARLLVGLLNSEHQDAAARALVALSGRDDLGTDPTRWRAWLRRIEDLPESSWTQELISALGGQTARAQARAEELRASLVETSRHLYRATPTEERSSLLARFLGDQHAATRALGYELATREISAGTPLGAEVSAAAMALLDHTSARARAQGAALLTRLAPEGAGERVTRALVGETDPIAAAPLLRAVARWPSRQALPVTLVWLESEGAADAASEVFWAAREQGLLDDEQMRERVLARLRERGPTWWQAAGLRLLVALGDETDIHAVAGLLDDPDRQRAAADALTLRPEGVPILLTAVQLDPALFSHASRAVRLHAPTSLNLRVLVGAAPAEQPQRLPQLLEVGRAMTTAELVSACEALPESDPLRESLLVLLADPEWPNDDPGARNRGLVLLAELRVQSGRAEPALSVLPARNAFVPDSDLARRIDRVQLRANLLLGRLDDARAIDAPVSAWLGAIGAVNSPAVVLAAIDHIEASFGPVLTTQERETIVNLRDRARASAEDPSGG
ncbi:MAG: hypothetical protein RIB32_00455 [Phycisphaerales bacterium]